MTDSTNHHSLSTDLEPNCTAKPEMRDLPRSGGARLTRLLSRAVRLRCPLCGATKIFTSPFSLRRCCPRCGYSFEREEGYFLGAYALNLVVAEVLGLGVIVRLLLRSDLSVTAQEAIAIPAAIILPIVFFPFSRTSWMALDLMLHPGAEPQTPGPGG